MAMDIKNKTIGITGGSGFIGTHLKKRLDLNKIPYTLFDGDLLKSNDVTAFFKNNKLSTVIHLAGCFSGSNEDLFNANFFTTQKILETGLKYGLNKIIYASSGAVYGTPKHTNGSSESDHLNPGTFYGLSKELAEDCIQFYHRTNGMEFVILRFPNVYGPGNQKGVIYDLLTSIKTKKEAVIRGNGSQTRQFLHVEDVCHALIKALNFNKSEIFNITPLREYSINEVVKLLKPAHTFMIKHLPPDNFIKMKLDPTKSTNLLSFIPRYQELSI